MLASEQVESIFGALEVMLKGVGGIREELDVYGESYRSKNVEVMEVCVSRLTGQFKVLASLAQGNELKLRELGITPPSQYRRLVMLIGDEQLREKYTLLIEEFERKMEDARQEMVCYQMVMDTQLEILQQVVGEMQLEINV
ncbi:hypothetical protein ACP3V3_02235 [Vibrio sp. PNB22_3_1]